MVLNMSLGELAWEWAGQRGSEAGWKSENFTGKVAKSDKLGPKERNSSQK
jgi:hypothetical protein